ncbi:MAG: class I adenylate-forming enzyme family protein [Smithellaceae bacterium]
MTSDYKHYAGNLVIGQYLDAMIVLSKRKAVTCLTYNREITYGELDKLTNQLDYKFRELKMQKNDVVMTCLLNTWHVPVTLLAAWKTPCIYSPINFRLAGGELAVHIEDSEPKVFVWDAAFDPAIKMALEMSKHKPKVLLCTKESIVPGAISFESYFKDAPAEDPECDERVHKILDPFTDEIIRFYTSGTTGRPKGTMISSDIYMHMDVCPLAIMEINWQDRVTNLTPWFHQGGMPAVTGALQLGGHVFGVPLAPFNPDTFLDMIEREKITLIMGAPVTLNALANAQKKKPRDISCLRWIQTVGAPFSREEYVLWRDNLGPHICNFYGTTETRQITDLNSRYHDLEKYAGTLGRAQKFTRARVIQVRPGERVDPSELAPRDGKTPGEIITQSPSVFLGYHNRPEETASHLYKGWFYTGDMATWDEDGFITIAGRTDDMIKSGAEKVYPVPVEEALMRNPKVQDVFVVPMPHERWGQAVAAYVLPKPGETLTVKELDDHCINDPNLANYMRPRFYQIVTEAMPYTATGKKMHYVMNNRAKEEVSKFIPIPSEKS